MMNLLRTRVAADPGPVGLFVETERGYRGGRPHRLFSEPRRKHKRAFGRGPPIVKPMRTVDPEVGSEGLVAQIVSQVFRENKNRATVHPGPDTIRQRKIRRFILVTDFIGSGSRACRYLGAAWRVRSVRSWWSARHAKGMSFEVITYSATEAGRRRVEAHPSRPSVQIFEGCPTIEQVFDIPKDRVRMEELCNRYGSLGLNTEPLGYGGIGALITFAHGMPNNAPAIFYKRSRSKSKPWVPLYPERVTSDRRSGTATIAERRTTIQADIWRVTKRRALESPRFLSAPSDLRDAVQVLLSLDRAPRTRTAISARTGLSVGRVRHALVRTQTYGWVGADYRITVKGRRELSRISARVQEAVEFKAASLYVSGSLRAPRSSR